MQVASGNGCSKAFICPYHAWTYSLEGELRAIRGKEAFPDMDGSLPKELGGVRVDLGADGRGCER